MIKPLISICFPIFNRKRVFTHSLNSFLKASANVYNYIEIVISDNFSSDDITSVVNNAKSEFPNIKIVYSKNQFNKGLANNYVDVVSKASGKYCWIVGSDDFVFLNSIEIIIGSLLKNENVDLITMDFDTRHVDEIIREKINNNKILDPFEITSGTSDDFIHNRFNNLFLGSMMVVLFKKEIWDGYFFNPKKLNGFDSIYNIYPHVVVFANCFLKKKAIRINTKLILAGYGSREWSTDQGVSFWDSSLPLIILNVYCQIANEYRFNNLEYLSQKSIDEFVSRSLGLYFLPFLYRLLFFKRIKDKNKIRLKIMVRFIFNFEFLKSLIKTISKKLRGN